MSHNKSHDILAMNDEAFFPAIPVAPSEIICHPSRISNIYEPDVERVYQPEIIIPEQRVTTNIDRKISPAHNGETGLSIRKAARKLLGGRATEKKMDLGERLIYDARFVFNDNMTHLIQHHLSALGYLRNTRGIEPDDITIVFEKKPSMMAVDVMNLAGYEVIATNGPVSGNVVTVDASLSNFFHLLSYVKYIDIGSKWISDTPAKLFIPRKTTRKLNNEREVYAVLHNHGFERVYFEEISIAEQWSLMRNATTAVAIHGAALGCLAFNAADKFKASLSVLELFGSGFVTNVFRKYVAVLGGRWMGCRGKITPEVARGIDLPGQEKKYAFDDFELSPRAVEVALTNLDCG